MWHLLHPQMQQHQYTIPRLSDDSKQDAADFGITERRRIAYKYMYYINEGTNLIPDAQK
jgi:hypothetical protein